MASMRLSEHECLTRLEHHDHGTFCTVHASRGVDAIPAVYAVHDGHVGIPVDTVKPKADGRLQRERNLDADPRATLLVDHWDRADWTRLWWVRAELRAAAEDPALADALAGRLAERFTQYRDRPFTRMLVLRVVGATGWSAA